MTSTPSDDTELQALYDAYALDLPAKLKAIDDLWARAAEGGDLKAVQSLHRALHSLSGSGQTFGYTQLSKSANVLEQAIVGMLDGDTLPRGVLAPLVHLLDKLRHAASVPDAPA
jgi:chemotaxis protein histidine kinase CheA